MIWFKRLGLVAALATAAVSATATAGSDVPEAAFPDAPEVRIGEWLTGEPISFDQEGKIYLVELWATWCGPCRESLPHLVDIQKQYGDKLAIVALSDEPAAKVRGFVSRNAYMKQFRTAVDVPGAKTTRGLMTKFEQRGIPVSFVLDHHGKVLWYGHPSSLGPVLPQVMGGTWRPDTRERLAAARRASDRYLRAVVAGPETADLAAMADKIYADARSDGMLMNEMAWVMLTEVPEAHRPLKRALRLATAAVEVSPDDHNILDTYALALHLTGDERGAIAQQRRALELCRIRDDECSHFEDVLARYERGGR